MTKNERENLRQEAFFRCLLLRFKVGCEALRRDGIKRFILLGYFALMFWMFWGMVDHMGTFSPLLSAVSGALFLLGFMVITTLVIALLGTPWGANSVSNNLRRAGLVNHAGEVLYGDNVFEKRGINRDEAGDIGKTRYFSGKQQYLRRERPAVYQQS